MATFNKGILGGFSGKVGTVIGANWRGKNVMRSIPTPSKKKPTDAQLLQQMRFAKAIDFLQPVRSITNRYFGGSIRHLSGYNEATSYTLKNALELIDDLPVIVPERALLTKGDLAAVQQLTLTATTTTLQADWPNNSGQGNAKATDFMNVVCYCEENKLFVLFEEVAQRDSESVVLNIPDVFAGKELDVWYYLSTEQRDKACTSMYLGKYTIG